MSIRVLVIDDEEPARKLIRIFLQEHPDIEVVGECADGFAGVKAIQEYQPDLVFLDIQMPKLTGFEMLELMDEQKPAIIFTTAYNEFAIKAFEINAVDYLLKPFSKSRFAEAIKRAVDRFKIQEKPQEPAVDKLVQYQEHLEENLERVVVKTGQRVAVIPVEKILYIEAQDDYVAIHTEEGKYLKQKTMNYFETHLDGGLFFRVHRSYIVQISQIKQIELFEKGSYLAILKTGNKIPVSKTGYSKLREIFD